MAIEIPAPLRELLKDDEHEAATLAFARAVATVLADNETPFFPGYTDHGSEHVERVLDASVRLVSPRVWEGKLLRAEDAAVLTLAVCLHDLAMHLREGGFLELVSPESRFQPVTWFDEPQAGRDPDLPWNELWSAFRREVRLFSQSDLDRLLGPDHDGVPQIAFGDHDAHPSRWTLPDRLVIGEFLRRHHARLAHEIALHGFPGAERSTFPVLAATASGLADAAGVVARSHGESLRLAIDYVSYLHPGAMRPCGALLAFHMGLLRVADYFQIDAGRAPVLLLHLKQPQSAVSVDEWNKHDAVQRVSWEHKDPRAVYVQVAAGHGLRTHLQLEELLAGLQRELDTTTAVLSETYRDGELAALRLGRQRVRTNLFEQSLHARLPYVPRRARLKSAEDLFRLVIGDLYGENPQVAGRELIQNAVDAVRERRIWEQANGSAPAGALRDLGDQVEIRIASLHRSACSSPDHKPV